MVDIQYWPPGWLFIRIFFFWQNPIVYFLGVIGELAVQKNSKNDKNSTPQTFWQKNFKQTNFIVTMLTDLSFASLKPTKKDEYRYWVLQK